MPAISDVPLETLASLPSFHHPVADAAGERVAFYYDGTGRNELYVLDVETGDRRQISDGEVPRDPTYPIEWSADGEELYFHSDEDGDEQTDIHALGLDGDHRVVIEEPGQNVLQDVSRDGDHLLYAGTRSGQMNLHRYDVDDGEDHQLTSYEQPVYSAGFDPEAEHIAYSVNETDDLENQDVYVAAADGSDSRQLDVGDDGVETVFADWAPDGETILLGDESPDLNRIGSYDLDDDSVTWFGDGTHEERPAGFHPDEESVLAIRLQECGGVPVRYDRETGEETDLDLDDGVASPIGGAHDGGVLADGDVLFTYTRPDARAELYRYDLDTGDTEVLIEAEYGEVDPDSIVDAEYVTVQSTGEDEVFDTEGEDYELDCLLYEAGDTAAAGVVQVHGGPHAWSSKGFNLYTQFLVSRGYTVLQPNYRGSIGRGREFKNAVHGDWGGLEQEDVAAAGRWLKRRESVDEDRVAVFGGSYGGYSAYMQLVKHPQLWTTGIAWVGITDLHSMFEESMPHFKTSLRQQMGDPEENSDLWRERSPLTHVDRIERPLLMIHGVNDPRCPISQARQFRDALEDRGWIADQDFVYEELDEEGHGSADIDQKIRAFTIVADYLDDWL
jgi:dipeptidyl aminopeptidase/acylaminoacyl peptidase